jgi:hypothetical protein
MSDFWDDFVDAGVTSQKTEALDSYLSGKKLGGDSHASVRALTDREREKRALPLPVEAGSRVTFASNVGSVLAYPDCPTDGVGGTVVAVKSSLGNITAHEEKVFVKWDDGKFIPTYRQHLRKLPKANSKQASYRKVVANLLDLTGFMRMGSEDELIHKATRDLWGFHVDDAGNYVIERLFNDEGEPLKV